MAWTESHQSLLDHRKTLRLARELGIDQVTAIGHLHIFWWWALDNAPDGLLTGIDPQDVATSSRFLNSSRDSKAFLKALLLAGFVDRISQGRGKPTVLQIHDWGEYGGKLIQSRARHRDVVRQSRDRPDNSRVDNSRVDQSRVEKKPPPTPSDDPAALTMDHEGEIRMEDDEYDPETLQQDLNALFPEGWKVKAHA